MTETEILAADDVGLKRAAELLRAGACVAFPTETVYGLGADASCPKAVVGIYTAKDRPSFNPLISHLPTIDAAIAQGAFNEDALALARAFWPGPLTLVVPVHAGTTICELARAGLPSVGLRVPDHPVAHAVLQHAGLPIAAPSANASGRISATTAAHVLADLTGRIAAVVDAGETAVGIESTIVDCTGEQARILRPGGITREQIEAVLGHAIHDKAPIAEKPLAPGMLASHYAPRCPVRLNASHVNDGEAALLFGAQPLDGLHLAMAQENLSTSGDLAEAAANLFSALRRLDEKGVTAIAVAPIPFSGLGEAINDRLSRAAAPRS